jgi:hypothetical protein
MAAVSGYRGELSDLEILPEGDRSLPAGPDLVKMAAAALDYLTRNPDPEHNYDSRFTFFPHLCPPFAAWVTANLFPGDWKTYYEAAPHIDPVAIGDTESRNDIAFNQMREMTGSDHGRDIQELVHRRLVGYLRLGSGKIGDDLCWVVPYSAFADTKGLPYASVWATGMLLHSETDLFRLTRDERHRTLARRLFEGLRRVASWDTGRAFYPGGGAPFRDGRLAPGSFSGHYPAVISPIVHYWQVCGDAEAQEFAEAMAEGFLADLQPGHLHKADGHIHGHSHTQMTAIKGIVQLGALTQNWRYLEWAKKAYDFSYATGFDTGWAPEIHWMAGHRNHSETCLVADLLEIQVWLARSGWPRLWDQVERTVRNYLAPAQFFLTPAFKVLWHEINGHRSSPELAKGLDGLRELEGGFLGSLAPNDRVVSAPLDQAHHGGVEFRGQSIFMDMAGCCSPSGMRALYLAWANTVLHTPQGIRANLALDHDGPEATVLSHLPRQGDLLVTPKVASDFWLRPPSWAPRDQVKAWRNKQAVESHWGGPACDYILFRDARPGELLALTWPLIRFKQRVTQRYAENSSEDWAHFTDGETYTFHWTGSTVTAVEPQGEWLPLYGEPKAEVIA